MYPVRIRHKVSLLLLLLLLLKYQEMMKATMKKVSKMAKLMQTLTNG